MKSLVTITFSVLLLIAGSATGFDRLFETAVKYPAGSQTYDIASGDFNNDGILDLVAANSYTGA